MKEGSFSLFGHDYTIKVNDNISQEQNTNGENAFWFGLNKADGSNSIEINTKTSTGDKLPDIAIKTTILHETLHAICDNGSYSSISQDEPFIEWAAKCLLQLTEQGFFDYIKEVKNE